MGGGGSSKSSEKFQKVIAHHQYYQGLCVLRMQKDAGFLSVCLNHLNLVCPSSSKVKSFIWGHGHIL